MHLGIIGYGSITSTLLDLLASDGSLDIKRLTLLARPAKRDIADMALRNHALASISTLQVVEDADAMVAQRPDLVVECAGCAAVADYAPALLRADIDVATISIGALADEAVQAKLTDAASAGRARLILPSGAIGGIDLLSALGAVETVDVVYRGTKPPKAWRGTPAEQSIALDDLRERTTFFQGSAREAALTYPKNANVAATLALAGGGFDATKVQLIADPHATGNSHAYDVVSPSARFTMQIEGIPSPGNAKTSVATVYSILREIKNHKGPVTI
ncbi:MAG: aspartate dehydrogenase [Pseudomonadota bacterium]